MALLLLVQHAMLCETSWSHVVNIAKRWIVIDRDGPVDTVSNCWVATIVSLLSTVPNDALIRRLRDLAAQATSAIMHEATMHETIMH